MLNTSLHFTNLSFSILYYASILLTITPFDANAFRSSSVSPAATTSPAMIILTTSETVNSVPSAAAADIIPNKKKIKYDLGLGKNPPVYILSSSSDEEGFGNNVTHYLVEHESVRPFPSPLMSSSSVIIDSRSNIIDENKKYTKDDSKENDKKKNQSENIKRRLNKNLPKIRHVRKSKDILHIHDKDEGRRVRNNNNENLTAVIVPIEYFLSPTTTSESNKPVAVTTKFDLNTVWVEMMIHNEHKKSEIRV